MFWPTTVPHQLGAESWAVTLEKHLREAGNVLPDEKVYKNGKISDGRYPTFPRFATYGAHFGWPLRKDGTGPRYFAFGYALRIAVCEDKGKCLVTHKEEVHIDQRKLDDIWRPYLTTANKVWDNKEVPLGTVGAKSFVKGIRHWHGFWQGGLRVPKTREDGIVCKYAIVITDFPQVRNTVLAVDAKGVPTKAAPTRQTAKTTVIVGPRTFEFSFSQGFHEEPPYEPYWRLDLSPSPRS
jgi:hypothetical protein